MRIGLMSPVVFRPVGQSSPWESTAAPGDLVTVVTAADRLGYHHVTCSEHTAVPDRIAARAGGTYWDPLATLAYLAALTTHVRLATHVLVLGYHHPLDIAKSYGTLDLLSGGRVILGVGVGSLEDEFALLDRPFRGRGARADDALRALRASWGRTHPTYDGTHYAFRDITVDPCAARRDVDIWVGGYTPRSLRRARELGTGWAPFGLDLPRITEMLGDGPRPDGFDVVLPMPPLDPRGDPHGTVDAVHAHERAGATVVNVALRAEGAAHWVEQATALRELLPDAGWTTP